MRAPHESQPSEPGWWLASDGLWYPPERPPSEAQWYPPEHPQYRGSVTQQSLAEPLFDATQTGLLSLLVVAASIVASVLFFGWDLSELDADEQPVNHPIPVTTARAVLAVLLVLVVVAAVTWRQPRAWAWIAGVVTACVELWFLWRAYSGRTAGANMAGAGAIFMLPPLIVGTFGPAYAVSLVKRRRSDTRAAL